MLESLNTYQQRTGFMWDSLPQYGGLTTSDGLRTKVNADGSFRPFYGDTVIFTLDDDTVAWLRQMQDELYRRCGDMLSERLHPATFHITLHDLQSSPSAMPKNVMDNEHRAMDLIESAKQNHPNEISINSCCMFSMVGTSVVMGFEPATDEDCRVLMQLYEDIQRIVPLSYPLTLHATLAYYKPGCYDESALHKLRNAFNTVGSESRTIRLDLNKLHYATFSSMNRYDCL